MVDPHRKAIRLLTFVGLAGIALTGWPAEDQRSERLAAIEEVIVTAQRREERAQDLGMSLTVFSSDQLQAMGIVDTSDLANHVPGFSYSLERRGTPIFTLRGVGFNDASAAALSPVGVYIDEVSLPYSVMSKGLNIDIQQIEILKGPQGTLYGRNTTAGAINHITNKPTKELEFGITATYARFDTTDVETSVSGGLDRVQGRVALRRIRSGEGWQTNQIFPGERFGEEDKLFGRAMLNWDIDERWNLVLGYSGWRDKSDGQMAQNHFRFIQSQTPGASTSEQAQAHPTISRDDPRLTAWHPNRDYGTIQERDSFYGLDQTFENIWAKFGWQVFETTELKLTLARQQYDDRSAYNTDGTAVELNEQFTFVDTDATSIELKLSGALEKQSVNWAAGYYKYTDSVDDIFLVGNRDASASMGGTLFQEGSVESRQDLEAQALFAQGDWQLFPTLNLTLGARYTEYTRDFEGCSRNDGLTPLFTGLQLTESGDPDGPGPGDCISLNDEGKSDLATGKLRENNVSGRLAAEWTPVEDLMVYSSAARGFKDGGFPNIPAARTSQLQPVVQEELRAYEIGIKSQWLSNSLLINTAAFYYDYRDKQLQSFTLDEVFGVLLKLENLDRVENKGADLHVAYTPILGLNISVTAIYIDATIRKFVGLNSEGKEQDFSGKKVNDAPQWEATARINYNFPLSEILQFSAFDDIELSAGVDFSYSDKSFGFIDNDPQFVTKNYRLVSVRAGLKSLDNTWSMTFWGRNITNEFYTTGFGKTSDAGYRFTGKPQTYGVTFNYHYGS